MNQPDYPKRQPYWLWQTKRLFPHPLFAGCISIACLTVAILFAGVAVSVPVWPMGIASALFFAGAFATAAAAVTKSRERTPTRAEDFTWGSGQTRTPTFAILVLLIGVYSWLLTLAMHVFGALFKNGPGSVKYYLTLGIAIASTLYMQFHGKRVVRRHFGARGGRNLVLSTGQAVYVVVFVVGCGIYLTWLLS